MKPDIFSVNLLSGVNANVFSLFSLEGLLQKEDFNCGSVLVICQHRGQKQNRNLMVFVSRENYSCKTCRPHSLFTDYFLFCMVGFVPNIFLVALLAHQMLVWLGIFSVLCETKKGKNGWTNLQEAAGMYRNLWGISGHPHFHNDSFC